MQMQVLVATVFTGQLPMQDPFELPQDVSTKVLDCLHASEVCVCSRVSTNGIALVNIMARSILYGNPMQMQVLVTTVFIGQFTMHDPFELPQDVSVKVLDYLHASEVCVCSRVSTQYRDDVARWLETPRAVFHRPGVDSEPSRWLHALVGRGVEIESIKLVHVRSRLAVS